ncbi:MAG: hypothetical protein E7525_00430 [Ruminococcaceae bacterium]|nr:hypothetical protein [Oscillospiraceae bacterium]
MKKIFKLLSLTLAIVMALGIFAGCHKKGEIAFTIGDYKYTSSMYSCALYDAAASARSAIAAYVSESGGDTSKIKYENYKFDAEGNVTATGAVTYETIVKNEAINTLKRFTVIQEKMAAENLTLPDDYKNAAEMQAYYYWYTGCDYSTYATYGSAVLNYYTPFAKVYEPNGVLYETYKQYVTYQTMYSYYFEHTYGEGGSKEVPEATLKEYLTTHYEIADTIQFSKLDSSSKELSAEKLAELKAKAEAYADRINKGEDFEDVYEEYQEELKKEQEANTSSSASTTTSSDASSNASGNESSTTSSTTSSTASGTTSSGEEEFTPPQYVGLYGDKETDYEHACFETLHKSDLNKAFVYDDTENKAYFLLVRRDILDEDYYFDNLEISILYDLKEEEFDGEVKTAAQALTAVEDKHATRPFKVKNIKI